MTSENIMLKPGQQAEDGTIYVGISPHNHQPMYTTPKNSGIMDWRAAQKQARRCDFGGHRDWRLPSVEEAFVMISARRHPGLKGTFGSAHMPHWTNAPYGIETNEQSCPIASGRTAMYRNGDIDLFEPHYSVGLRLIRTPAAPGGALRRLAGKLGL